MLNRSELVDQCRRLIEEAYAEATEMIVAYLEKHPNEPRQPLCKDIEPDNWKALESRVMRLQEKRRAGDDSDITIGRKPTWQVGDARRAFSNPEIPSETKAAVVVEALEDQHVAAQVADRIASDPTLLRKVERAQTAERQRIDPPNDSIDEAWTRWLNELNTVLIKGARLADRMEREHIDPGLIPQVALYAYRLITEKHIDAEIRALLEREGVH